MDHKQEHHQQHRKEREHHIEQQKAHERAEEAKPRTIHPAWFVFLGSAFILLIVLTWTLFL